MILTGMDGRTWQAIAARSSARVSILMMARAVPCLSPRAQQLKNAGEERSTTRGCQREAQGRQPAVSMKMDGRFRKNWIPSDLMRGSSAGCFWESEWFLSAELS